MWCLVAVLLALGACGATSHGRAETDVVFAKYSSLSQPSEVARRTLPPIAFRRLQEDLAARNQRLADQAIDLAKEKFDIYVPSVQPPPPGFGVLVYVAPWAKISRNSMRDNCVLDLRDVIEMRVGHRAADGAAFDRALDALDAKGSVDADELARCNEHLESKLTAELARVAAAIARGDRDGARAQLMAIDARYGGLAAPRSIELYDQLTAPK